MWGIFLLALRYALERRRQASEQEAALRPSKPPGDGEMKLSWMFGSSLAQHHLLYAYVSVWLIQGGYCAWIVSQWARTRGDSQTDDSSGSRED